MKKSLYLLLAATLIFSACTKPHHLKKGIWRGVLTTKNGDGIPFNFEIKDTGGHKQMVIFNGTERFKVDSIKQDGDSVFIKMPLFDSEFKLQFADHGLQGKWIKHLGQKDVAMDFNAKPGLDYRFFKHAKEPRIVTGRWSAIFEGDKPDTTVAEFKQSGDNVTGTFLTTTGDYRYLEGTVHGGKLLLSCFDGGHAFLFKADLKGRDTLVNGQFFAGYTSKTAWNAVRNEKAKLPDAYSLTALTPGYKKLDFSFPDVNGKKVSLSDPQFKDKVVIVEIMGSWCPNCMDQTAYLVDYYKKYHSRGVEVLGLAYERTKDFNKSKASLEREIQHFNIPYPLLITGYTNDKKETAASLPAISNFIGFPTTLIIDKSGNVRKIYAGFSGPGTGNYYTEFIAGFEKLTDDLLAEKTHG
ncbi:peroxiredoxin family protein [Mucilaginibacter ginkgonis]|uniref:TlpA family protein disulfide reductase n=1 Tax=Mucilaginibacter ginkgonis TaxID=2682091 RepID=A0A6I4IND6_9SPHI|nr:TlpA disulfide reductase family protein [Mucilaginibacter ginkgonis]QQL49718.1 TlpA family protein disulfide reductase [Mucilaginibacter ginkgonis]